MVAHVAQSIQTALKAMLHRATRAQNLRARLRPWGKQLVVDVEEAA